VKVTPKGVANVSTTSFSQKIVTSEGKEQQQGKTTEGTTFVPFE
jgi:hypothetical protein